MTRAMRCVAERSAALQKPFVVEGHDVFVSQRRNHDEPFGIHRSEDILRMPPSRFTGRRRKARPAARCSTSRCVIAPCRGTRRDGHAPGHRVAPLKSTTSRFVIRGAPLRVRGVVMASSRGLSIRPSSFQSPKTPKRSCSSAARCRATPADNRWQQQFARRRCCVNVSSSSPTMISSARTCCRNPLHPSA